MSSSALGIYRVFFFNFGNSNRCGVVSHYISIFTYITLMTDGVGHLTMCSSAFIYPLWGSSLYKSCPFPNWVVCFFLLNPECLYLFWYKSFVKYVTCKYFIPLWGVSFYLQRVLCRAKVLNFYQVQIIFSFMDHALYIHMAERSKSKETLPNPQSQNPHVIPIWLKHQALGQLRVLSYVVSMMLVLGFKESTKNPLVHCNKQRVRAS